MAGDTGRVYYNATIKAGEGVANIPSDVTNGIFHSPIGRSEGGFAAAKIGGLPEIDEQLNPSNPIAEKRGLLPRFDFSGALANYQSRMYNRDATGKFNPDGQTMGKTVDTGVAIGGSAVVGNVFASVKPLQALNLSKARGTNIFGARGTIPVEPNQFGTHRGIDSGRRFFPDEIGIPIRDLAGRSARITPRGIAVVEKHLSRFGYSAENLGMIKRLKDISAGKLQATQSDINFYTHELREYVRYRNLGFEKGLPVSEMEQMRLWNNTHTATLEDYGLKEDFGVLYHPSIEPK